MINWRTMPIPVASGDRSERVDALLCDGGNEHQLTHEGDRSQSWEYDNRALAVPHMPYAIRL